MVPGALPGDFPAGVVVLAAWHYAGVECVVGSVAGELYGLARVRQLGAGWSRYRPGSSAGSEAVRVLCADNLGAWMAFELDRASRFWSQEVHARFGAVDAAELSALDGSGHVWALEHGRAEVEAFVDGVLRSAVSRWGRSG